MQEPVVAAPATAEMPMFHPDPHVFDAEAVERLRSLDPQGQSGLLERLYRTFLGSLRKQLPQLQEACTRGDLDALRFAVHTLKSSAASVGALKFSVLAADIESKIRSGGTGPFDAQVTDLAREAARLEASLHCQLEADP